MLKQADKDKAKKHGYDLDAIIAAHLDAAEKDITVPDGEILTADQLTTRDANSEKEGIKKGEKAALPIAVAEINKHTGLKIDATKIDRFGDLGEHLKTELGKTSDERLKIVNEQVKDLLKDKETLTSEMDGYKTKAAKVEFEYGQYGHLPENRAKTFKESEYLAMLPLRGVEVKPDGIYRNNEVMKDEATKAPLAHKAAYEKLFTEFNWIATAPAGAAGGRGGGNSGGGAAGKSRTQSEAISKWKEANPGKNEISPEAQTFVQAEAKDNVSFDWNN